MPGLFRPSYTDRNPKTGKKIKKRASRWYGWYKDDNGKTVRVPLSADKAVAQQLLAKLLANRDLGRAGLLDPYHVEFREQAEVLRLLPSPVAGLHQACTETVAKDDRRESETLGT